MKHLLRKNQRKKQNKFIQFLKILILEENIWTYITILFYFLFLISPSLSKKARGVSLNWNEKIFDEINKDELRLLSNPLEHFKLEEEKEFIFFIIVF